MSSQGFFQLILEPIYLSLAGNVNSFINHECYLREINDNYNNVFLIYSRLKKCISSCSTSRSGGRCVHEVPKKNKNSIFDYVFLKHFLSLDNFPYNFNIFLVFKKRFEVIWSSEQKYLTEMFGGTAQKCNFNFFLIFFQPNANQSNWFAFG